MQEETKMTEPQKENNGQKAVAETVDLNNKQQKSTQKYEGRYMLHDAIQEGASVEEITALLSPHPHPVDCNSFISSNS